MAEVFLFRHGQTEWSKNGRHTGSRTDLPLLDEGRRQAEELSGIVQAHTFARVFSSPLQRALDTCRLAGLGERAELRDELLEWDYGEYEGITTPDIREANPGWNLWRDGCPGGESADDVGARVDKVIDELRATEEEAALFAHGHVLRILAARWTGLGPESGARLSLSTGTYSALGYERETPVIKLWNAPVGG